MNVTGLHAGGNEFNAVAHNRAAQEEHIASAPDPSMTHGTAVLQPQQQQQQQSQAGDAGMSAQEARILRMQQQAREYEEVERQRHERRLQKQREKVERARQREENYKIELKNTARRMFWIGCAALPLMWGVMLLYFWKEFRDPEADQDIRKYCKLALACFVLFNLAWIAWYTVFVIYSDTKLAGMNISLYQTAFAPIKI
mmetsp:Transcript_15496/g.41619  ORF Transcript_15496/g.41619 Transcript_15496/m.41619 type:complete len:199 (+) Transcript_15496:80-676(+)